MIPLSVADDNTKVVLAGDHIQIAPVVSIIRRHNIHTVHLNRCITLRGISQLSKSTPLRLLCLACFPFFVQKNRSRYFVDVICI